MLTPKEIDFIRDELATAKKPLFLYDDDADGLGSFLLLYRLHREGKGFRVTTTSKIDNSFLKKVEEINPDKIFILDIPLVEQEFVDNVKKTIIWIDHHLPQQVKNVHYFNPRIKDPDAYIPTTRMAYQVSGNPDDIWIAAAGCLGDWHMPDFIEEFIEKYPHLMSEKEDLATASFKSPVGKLVKMFFFFLKGPTTEVRKSIKVLSRIKSPDEIFNQESSAGKFLYKRFVSINSKFEEVLKEAKKVATRSKLLVFIYPTQKWSFTANLSNELRSLYPQKVVLIARNKNGEMKCSLRGENILPALNNALIGIRGSGGGHPNACGVTVKEEDWDRFLKNLKREIQSS
ncbi:MAG: DHH family phosphoesterase [Nanoarchaeota archaeon]|nr:DHH family phosphoesterase [Nanoarchaeota archaeon]MBU1644360.1 DHH family phosphoesterase [Nanoarchaeota archaeon]MBU1976809.1 DHH family phosphoesterase [Nanoarchaeota archaeon]